MSSAVGHAGALLVLVCDVSPESWAAVRASLGFAGVFRAVEFALHAHLRLNATNAIALVACRPGGSRILLPPPGGSLPTDLALFQEVQDSVRQGLAAFAEEAGEGGGEGTALASALSLALCYIHRVCAASPETTAQILVLSASPDTPAQYVSVMNALFSAHKMGVVVDGCHVAGEQSAFLQQAADLTGGVYLRPQDPTSLLQQLLSTVLCPKPLRAQLPFPSVSLVQCKAACFCHRKEVETGHVCSVCFSIYCAPRDVCATCSVPFRELKRESAG
eukprot:EG_transcript_19155